jgi:hypothetical protein
MASLPTLYDAQVALDTVQEGLGEMLGVSRRTIVRWTDNGGWKHATTTAQLARLVFPKDPALAARFAAVGGHTLESLGLVVPRPPPPPPPAPVAKPAPMPRAIDVVVCAAADAVDGTPRAARVALLAAVRAAREMGLDLLALEAALAPPASAPADKARAAPKA